MCGILVMALPIPIVVDNFADYYQEQKKLEATELKAEAAVEEEEWRGEQHLTAMQGLAETIRTTDLRPTFIRASPSHFLCFRPDFLAQTQEKYLKEEFPGSF